MRAALFSFAIVVVSCSDDRPPSTARDGGAPPGDSALADSRPIEHPDAGPCTPSAATGSWARIAGPSLDDLVAFSDNDVWAVGFAALTHWDGSTWREYDAGQLTAAWASGPNDVWALNGPFGEYLHWDGTAWSEPIRIGRAANDLWGSGPNDVWATCDDAMAHWDGATWDLTTHPITGRAGRLWGFGANDVWSIDGSTAWHFDGSSWTTMDVGTTNLRGLWGCAPDDLWAVGSGGHIARWHGSSWTAVPSGVTADLSSVFGASCTDVWAVGDGGTALHWNGTTWTAESTPATNDLRSVVASSSGTIWVSGHFGTLLRRSAGSWEVLRLGGSTEQNLTDAWGADGVLYVTTSLADVRSTDGATWTVEAMGTGNALVAISGTARTNVWAIGDSLAHNDSGSWVVEGVPNGGVYGGSAVWTGGPTDTWISAFDGFTETLSHYDGAAWTAFPDLGAAALWGASAPDVWAVGDGTRHWDGAAWSEVPIETDLVLGAVWGRASNDVWAVGREGVAAHWDGAGWIVTSAGTTAELQDIAGNGGGELLAVGDRGTIVRYNCGWEPMESGVVHDLRGVWVEQDGEAWAVGAVGTVLRYTP